LHKFFRTEFNMDLRMEFEVDDAIKLTILTA